MTVSDMKRSSISHVTPVVKFHHGGDYEQRIENATYLSISEKESLSVFMQGRHSFETKILYINLISQSRLDSVDDLLRNVELDASRSDVSICIVENISPRLLTVLGNAWAIDPAFFALHVSNPDVHSIWQPYEWDGSVDPRSKFDRLVGIYEFHNMDLDIDALKRHPGNHCHRHIFKDGDWPVNWTTNVSYIRVSETLYLFLIDPPISYKHALHDPRIKKRAPIIRFPYSQSYGGLIFPSIDAYTVMTPFDILQGVFKHYAPLVRIFQRPGAFPKMPMASMLSASLWYSRMVDLDKRIRDISFDEVSRSNETTTNTLHSLREEVITMRRAAAHTVFYTSSTSEEFWKKLWREYPSPKLLHPIDAHRLVLSRGNELNTFLLETFQLLMNTISIRDSQLSIKLSYSALLQTNQGILLTRLATVYLPLTLATGIFGMNISQLNDNGQPIWVFIITCLAIMGATFVLLSIQLRQLRKKEDQGQRV